MNGEIPILCFYSNGFVEIEIYIYLCVCCVCIFKEVDRNSREWCEWEELRAVFIEYMRLKCHITWPIASDFRRDFIMF